MKNIWAIVPIKPLNRSKSRLSSVLDIKQREALSREMLEQTLNTLKRVQNISGIMVVSRDTHALSLARRLEVQTLQESGAPELNASLIRASQVVATWNAGGVLVIASDIPMMQAEDIESMVSMAQESPCIVIAPDRHNSGTNALLIRPPAAIPFRFGINSFQKHSEEARAAGVKIYVYKSPTVSLDVDVPADLDMYREMLMERELNEPAWLGDM